MKVAIFGDGLLGRTLFDYFSEREKELLGDGYVVMLSHADVEITDRASVERVIAGHNPDVAINTVAFHRLAECERQWTKARAVNTQGAKIVSSLVPTVYISSDYVFNDGGPHDEVLPGQKPRSIYGQTKLGGELATLENGGIVVRVSGLYGKHPSHKGPSFPESFQSSYQPITLPSDQRFSPTYAPDAAERIAFLAMNPTSEGIYHATNSGSTTWAQFGDAIASLGHTRRKVIAAPANDPIRPKNSSLRSTRLLPLRHWYLALEEWCEWRGAERFRTAVSPLRAGA